MLKSQGVTWEAAKRLREQLMVQQVAVAAKVALRISVTEQEIDQYLARTGRSSRPASPSRRATSW